MATSDYILHKLDSLQKSFHPALRNGGEELASFHNSFSNLINDSGLHTAHQRIQDRVRSFVDTVTTISSALLEIETASQSIYESLDREIARLAQSDFRRLSLSDAPETVRTPYIECCYVWLLGHLHNPYPSKVVRRQFAQQSGTLEKDIDAWFIEARKHIGWNEIRRAHFATRFDLVKAATRHYNPTSRRIRRDPEEIHAEDYSTLFVDMENTARNWYSHKLFPTPLAAKLQRLEQEHTAAQKEASSSYPSPERTPSRPTKPSASSSSGTERKGKRRNSEMEGESALERESPPPPRPSKRSRISTPSVTNSNPAAANLPSPAQSLQRELSYSMSPSVAQSSLEEEGEAAATDHLDKRKRRQSDTSDYDSDSSRASRPRRRRRVGQDDQETGSKTKLKTPVTHKETPTSQIAIVSEASQSSPSPTSKRKRRLSDVQDGRPWKHPHHAALSAPRLQTVSNPLPMSSSFVADHAAGQANVSSSDGILQAFDLEMGAFTFDNGSSLDDFGNLISPEQLSYDGLLQHQNASSGNFQPQMSGSFQDASHMFNLSENNIPQTTTPSYPQNFYDNSGNFGLHQQMQQAPAVDLMAEFRDAWQFMSDPAPNVSNNLYMDLNIPNLMNSQSPASTMQPQDMLLSNMNHNQSANVHYPDAFNGLQTYPFDDDKHAKQQKMQELLAEVELLRSELDL